jgi:lipopolysaccharide/colanic/teichoic acid biosynthesis glycosyltransferase
MRDLATRPRPTRDTQAPAAAAGPPAGSIDGPTEIGVAADGGVDAERRPGLYERHGKRALDIALGVTLAIVSLPLVACVALLAFITGGRPLLYGSLRVGQGGRAFVMWKFRTMVADADEISAAWDATDPHLAAELRANWGLRHDPRVTWTGRFLRRSSLDELPQLWNVIRGDMSLVGPRPYLPREIRGGDLVHAIHVAKPGLTGPFQVGGRKDMAPRERMAIEARYGTRITLAGDASYLARTIKALVKMDGR